jgi:hypothetical protein
MALRIIAPHIPTNSPGKDAVLMTAIAGSKSEIFSLCYTPFMIEVMNDTRSWADITEEENAKRKLILQTSCRPTASRPQPFLRKTVDSRPKKQVRPVVVNKKPLKNVFALMSDDEE